MGWIPWLLLIPKPGRPLNRPKALRPPALQEPVGKSVVGLLAQIAQREPYDTIAPLPVWAYIPRRSTQHAIQRVTKHTKAGRALVESQKPKAFHRKQELPTFRVCRAVQLCLDLQQAFDTVCRQELFSRLHEPRPAQDNPCVSCLARRDAIPCGR